MKNTFHEKFSNFFVKIARPVIFRLLAKEIDVVSRGDSIPKETEPFILISNHFNTWDSFIIMKNIKANVRFLATEVSFLDSGKKFGMGVLGKAIPKRVGKPDFLAAKKIFDYLKLGYSIGLFPEGDNTFYGETLPIYKSTGRLIKKANVNVVLVKQSGGYLSQPRWADYFSKKGKVHTDTKILITKEELQKLTEKKINKIVEEALYNNEYDFQKERMIRFEREKRAEGIERLIYFCNYCKSSLTVFGHGDDIYCSKCGKIGHINEFELIEGNKYDNLVDYNHYQYSRIADVIKSEFVFVVTLNLVNFRRYKNIRLGKYKVRYKDEKLFLSDKLSTYTFELAKMKYPVNTMRHSFSFDYGEETYNFTDIRHQFVLYEMCRYLSGIYKN